MKIRCIKNELLTDYVVPLLLEFAIIGVLILLFYICLGKGPVLQEVKPIGSEVARPTLGKLIYGILSFTAFVMLSVMASKSSNVGKDTKAFWLGFIAGVLLWQAAGELVWHFSVGGTNFILLESIASFPILVLTCMLFVYCCINRSLDWGVFITFTTFMCMWIGHYVTIGIYPVFADIIDKHIWIIAMSLIVGLAFLILSIIYLLKRTKTKRGRMLASLVSFISLAIIVFGVIEG